MKRFAWRLQRVLDVRLQRERAMRAELLKLAREIASAREEIQRRQAMLRQLLAELGAMALEQRLPRQEAFMRTSAAAQEQMRQLREQLDSLETARARKMDEFHKARAARRTLERLREEARDGHQRQQARQEQNQLDERAQVAFARNMAATRGVR